MTWAEMLTKLKRLDRGLKDLSDNPEYFLDGGDKRDWSFVDVDGHHFISAGKHRSAILRYCAYYYPEFFTHGALAHGVRVRKVYQDYETTKICKSITHEISDFPHLEFVYMGKLGHEHRWQLRNRRQHNAWNISRSQLHELHDDLMGSTPIKRILGLGYQACIRENLWAGFNPNDAKLRGC